MNTIKIFLVTIVLFSCFEPIHQKILIPSNVDGFFCVIYECANGEPADRNRNRLTQKITTNRVFLADYKRPVNVDLEISSFSDTTETLLWKNFKPMNGKIDKVYSNILNIGFGKSGIICPTKKNEDTYEVIYYFIGKTKPTNDQINIFIKRLENYLLYGKNLEW